MSTTITVGNLPAGTSIEEMRQELADIGAPVQNIELVEGGDPDRLSFLVQLDIDPHIAKLMAERRRERIIKGRKITIYVPGFGA